jgi:hypothetical protein
VRSGLRCEWYEENAGHYGHPTRYGSNSENFYTFSIKSAVPKNAANSGLVKREAHHENPEEQRRLSSDHKGKTYVMPWITTRRKRLTCDSKYQAGRKWIVVDGNPSHSTPSVEDNTLVDARYPSRISNRMPPNLKLGVPGTQHERMLFNYFINESIPDLCGYSHVGFWYKSVPLYSQSEPAIRYAVLSLAAFHQERIGMQNVAQDDSNHKPSTLIAYSRALQQGQGYLSSPNPNDEVVLMCCLLFYMIENARGDFNTATRHALAGLAILRKFGAKPKSKVNLINGPLDDINDALVGHFATLDGRFSFGSNYTRPGLTLTTEQERSGLTQIVPVDFRWMSEISACELKLTNWVFHLLSSIIREHEFESLEAIPNDILLELEALRREQDRAEKALEDFYQKRIATEDVAWNDVSQVLNHQIHHHSTVIILCGAVASATSSEPLVDMLSQFKRIVHLAETLRNGLISNEPGRRSFLCLRGVVSSLVLVAVECDDEEVRKESIYLLRIWPISEGLIDGKKAADAIERRDVMREAGIREQSPPVPNKPLHMGKASAIIREVVRLSVAVSTPRN